MPDSPTQLKLAELSLARVKMSIEILLLGGAMLVSLLALLLSPFVRAICWDSFVHPRYRCIWEKRGREMRELKACIDRPGED